MSSTLQVVDGEASESDSEVEIEIGRTPVDLNAQLSNAEASVISGEASESDDESRLTPPIKSETPPPPPAISPNHLRIYGNSILHQRLWEVNVSMRRDIEVLGLHTMKLAYERMASLNRELLALQDLKFALEFAQLDNELNERRDKGELYDRDTDKP